MFYLKPLFLIDRCFSADLVTELKFATELLSSEKMQTKIHTFIQTLRQLVHDRQSKKIDDN